MDGERRGDSRWPQRGKRTPPGRFQLRDDEEDELGDGWAGEDQEELDEALGDDGAGGEEDEELDGACDGEDQEELDEALGDEAAGEDDEGAAGLLEDEEDDEGGGGLLEDEEGDEELEGIGDEWEDEELEEQEDDAGTQGLHS